MVVQRQRTAVEQHFISFRWSTGTARRSEEHTSELQSPDHLVSRLLLENKKLYRALRARRTFSFTLPENPPPSTTALARRDRRQTTDLPPGACTAFLTHIMRVVVPVSIH